MKRLAILGASGHGKVIADAAQCSQNWDEIIFFDDQKCAGFINGHWPVVGGADALLADLDSYDGVIVGIGKNDIRLENSRLLQEQGANLVSIIHPTAIVSSHCEIGAGTLVCAGAILNVDSVIGLANIINTSASIDHDCLLSDGVHISPGANLSGAVAVGECSWVGIGSAVRQLIEIGSHSIVGAGSVVVSDVPSNVTVVGNPARII